MARAAIAEDSPLPIARGSEASVRSMVCAAPECRPLRLVSVREANGWLDSAAAVTASVRAGALFKAPGVAAPGAPPSDCCEGSA